jgi:hypothetical protein
MANLINNYLSPLEFQVAVARLPETEFFTQMIQIPSVSTNVAETQNPMNRLVWTPDKTQYDQLSLEFIVDENMENYINIYDWIIGTTGAQDYSQYKNLKASKNGLVSDISILILTNKKNPNIKITYRDCLPVALSGLVLDTRSDDIVYSTATVTFSYNYFEISKIND